MSLLAFPVNSNISSVDLIHSVRLSPSENKLFSLQNLYSDATFYFAKRHMLIS